VRALFREQLDALRGLLVVMAASATSAIRWASDALMEGDPAAAQRVLVTAAELDRERQQVEETIRDMLVRQQPVASDLRLALAGLHVAGDIERMGALAGHIAKIMLLRHPVGAIPAAVEDIMRRMGEIAEELGWKVARALEVGDQDAGEQLDRDDDEMDALHRNLFEALFGDWPFGAQAAVDVALVGRFYERYADHAVNAGRQVAYLVTGEPPTR
jgi:phosphate transport system protein